MTARMLQEPFTIQDVLDRGICLSEPDGTEAVIFDRDHRFAVFLVKDGVAREVLRGPFSPDDK